MAHYCQKLEHFDICGCDIFDLAIEKIASLCTNLKFLNIQLCWCISENAVKMFNPNIKVKGIDRFAWVAPLNNIIIPHNSSLTCYSSPQLSIEQINNLIAEALHQISNHLQDGQSYTHDSING